jgi:hypothetical protein
MTKASAPGPQFGVVVVERYLHAASPAALAALADDTRAAVGAVRAEGGKITYLGSVLIPEDETCFCMFEADSLASVASVNARVDAPCVHVAVGVAIGAFANGREVPD